MRPIAPSIAPTIRNGPAIVEPIATKNGALRSQPESPDDRPFLFALHETVKGAELAAMQVPEPIWRQLVEMQFRAMTEGYRSMFPAADYRIITLEEAPIGRLITDQSQDRFHIVHIALLPTWRHRGIGSALMTAVLAEPRHLGVICEATVDQDNLASLRLWTRLGFAERTRAGADLIMRWPPA